MAHTVILGPREHHLVRDLAGYRRAHAAAIAKKRARGMRVAVHVSKVPLAARVDGGTWLVDCECGAGNAVDPEDRVALCFGCGAVHEGVEVPDPAGIKTIEKLLLARPTQKLRGWRPGETANDLLAENRILKVGEL